MSSNNSKIEWTDKTWNPVTGCTKVSQGCKNCYAERIYERFNGKGSFKNVICHDDRLGIPLSWKKPSMIFVNSMSDLFHEDVPFKFIDCVFDYMHAAHWHIFQVLTKRAARMVEFYKWKSDGNGFKFREDWPFNNVWIGVSVEDQEAGNERIPYLLQVPASVRFLSCEPLLGPLDITSIDAGLHGHHDLCRVWPFTGEQTDMARPCHDVGKLHWVICGGESGPGARPMHPDWASSLRDQCKAGNVPFFFKQWGNHGWYGHGNFDCLLDEDPAAEDMAAGNVGKKKAGRLLYGQLHNEFPKSISITNKKLNA